MGVNLKLKKEAIVKNKAGAMWVVETYTFLDGWVNVWRDDAGRPVRFRSRREAVFAMGDLLREVNASVKCGDMPDGYEADEYRVVRVG